MENVTEIAEQLRDFFDGYKLSPKQSELLDFVAAGNKPSNAPASIYTDPANARLTFRRLLEKAQKSGFNANAQAELFTKSELIKPIEKPVGGKTRYYILSSCQDESIPHVGFLRNLEAYAAWLGDCEIMISGFTYNKSVFSEGTGKKTGKKTDAAVYHELLRPYLQNSQFRLCDGLLFCGEMNTLPTAVRPLSGFETYTDQDNGIFPHTRVQLESIPTAKKERAKQLMTTGCITLPNYVKKKAGLKASWHHIIGAILVEVDSDGNFYTRHLQADTSQGHDGDFYDLDRHILDGEVTSGHRIEALNAGDIHHEKFDPDVALTTFGYDVELLEGGKYPSNLLDSLKPRHVFMHDLSDFSARNHHNIKDPHFRFKTHHMQTDDVEFELLGCAKFLSSVRRDFANIVVVQSNHDNALLRWLKSVDWREDMTNAIFYMKTQLRYLQDIERGESDPPIFEDVLRDLSDDNLEGVQFVAEDDSYLIAGGIECAMHGHLGANGSRGNPKQFSKFGRKSNTGHTHSPAIFDGAYVAGVSGNLDMGYNKGASSWSQAHILTYSNGKRTIVTFMGGKWFAGQ